MKPKANIAVRSRDEVAHAIRILTTAQWARLKMIAAVHARKCPMEAKDLLQEALFRACDQNGRTCPQHVDIVKFLDGVMRSIADGENDKAKIRPALVGIANYGDPGSGTEHAADPAPDAEEFMAREAFAGAIRRNILSLFDDDPRSATWSKG